MSALRNGRIVLEPYDTEWPRQFATVRERILAACGDLLAGVEHIGSTSVPGLAAKPIIDVMPVLHRAEDGELCVPLFEALGYRHRGEFGIPGRRYFNLDDATGRRLQNVHMYEAGHPEYVAHLAFRDLLREDDSWRERYEALKRELAERFPHDVEAYADAKSDFVTQAVNVRLAQVGGAAYVRIR